MNKYFECWYFVLHFLQIVKIYYHLTHTMKELHLSQQSSIFLDVTLDQLPCTVEIFSSSNQCDMYLDHTQQSHQWKPTEIFAKSHDKCSSLISETSLEHCITQMTFVWSQTPSITFWSKPSCTISKTIEFLTCYYIKNHINKWDNSTS